MTHIKRIALLSVIFILCGFTPVRPQQNMFKSVESAIALGSAEKLADFLNTSVELGLPGDEEGIYSKSQAIVVLKKFFDRYPPVSFNISRQGNSAAGSRFAVGDYLASEEKTFRVTIFMQKVGSVYLIREMEFE